MKNRIEFQREVQYDSSELQELGIVPIFNEKYTKYNFIATLRRFDEEWYEETMNKALNMTDEEVAAYDI